MEEKVKTYFGNATGVNLIHNDDDDNNNNDDDDDSKEESLILHVPHSRSSNGTSISGSPRYGQTLHAKGFHSGCGL
jgi:hypothetical protein